MRSTWSKQTALKINVSSFSYFKLFLADRERNPPDKMTIHSLGKTENGFRGGEPLLQGAGGRDGV